MRVIINFLLDKDYSWDVGDGIDGNKNDMLDSIGQEFKKKYERWRKLQIKKKR